MPIKIAFAWVVELCAPVNLIPTMAKILLGVLIDIITKLKK